MDGRRYRWFMGRFPPSARRSVGQAASNGSGALQAQASGGSHKSGLS